MTDSNLISFSATNTSLMATPHLY